MTVKLSNLGIGLASVFLFFLLALAAELFYIVWWRRRFRRENSAGADITGDPYVSPSKELLFFLCWKNQSRVEPAGATPGHVLSSAGADFPSRPESDSLSTKARSDAANGERDDAEWTKMYGPSRVLFTINEEREVSLSAATDDLERGVREPTPFSTPCDSPLFYTPSSSPPRESKASP
ncbi:uncharacterized protein LOC131235265 [Magnolia sinica]|uniref:uncharacterized protein LOC131235265 n=1 Tax=Magnolia sinica TaxID=86752 RepID=UPI00265AD1CB|nr:uncharacterized protein LOC131235265 [Magnolia sinica]